MYDGAFVELQVIHKNYPFGISEFLDFAYIILQYTINTDLMQELGKILPRDRAANLFY